MKPRIVVLTKAYCKDSEYTQDTKFEVIRVRDGVVELKNPLYPMRGTKLVTKGDIQDAEI